MPANGKPLGPRVSDLFGERRLDVLYRRHRENSERFEASRVSRLGMFRRLFGAGTTRG